jgi:hypothetical protein
VIILRETAKNVCVPARSSAAFPAGIALALMGGVDSTMVVVGLIAFGIIFAMNSAEPQSLLCYD